MIFHRAHYLLLASLLTVACGDDGGDGTETQNPGGSAGQAPAGSAGQAGAGQSGSSGQGGAGQAGAGAGGGGQGGGGQGGGGQAGAGAGGAGAGGAGAGGDAGAAGQANTALVAERWGARARGSGLAVRRSGRSLWMGSRSLPDPYTGEMRGGLERLNLDTGEVTVFEDELPKFAGENGPEPMPTADAIDDGDRTLVLGRGGLLVRQGGAFTLKDLGSSPVAMALDRGGNRKRLWVATGKGLVRLDADTLAVEQTLSLEQTGGEVAKLAVESTGDLYAVSYGDQGGSRALRIGLDGTLSSFVPGEGGIDAGVLGEVVVSDKAGGALFTLATWDAKTGGVLRWNGAAAPTRLVTEGQLAMAATGKYGGFGAAVLTIDDEAGVLIVGGKIAPTADMSLIGGGLAWVEIGTGKLAGLSSGRDGLTGDHIDSLAYDPQTRRVHALVRQPCSHTKLGNRGLISVSFQSPKQPRYERPILSGVRSVTRQGDRTLVGLRDDNPGMACDGYPIQTGLYRLQSNRSGELVPLNTSTDLLISPDAGPTALAASGDRLAIATWRDGGVISSPTSSFVFNPTTYGPSLYMLDVAWQGTDSVWIAGRATHHSNDPANLADVGPFGAARLTLDAKGGVASADHYVRKSRDPGPHEGLPSSEVTAVVALSDTRALLACATERVEGGSYDRSPREVFSFEGKPRLGGIAVVDADGVQVLADGTQAPDPRAAALASDGTVVVLDATKGALRVKLDGGPAVSPLTLPVAPPEGAIPQSVWAGPGDALVAGYDRGAVVRLGGASLWVEGAGVAWRAAARSSAVVLVGSEEGLVRVRGQGVADEPEAAPGEAVLPEFLAIAPVGDGGQCLPKDSQCTSTAECCPGLTCGGSGFVQSCK